MKTLRLVLAAVCLVCAGAAFGQSINANRFSPAIDERGMLSVESGEIGNAWDFNLSFGMSYLKSPLIFVDEEGNKLNEQLINYRIDGLLHGSVSFVSFFEAGIALPIIFYQDGATGLYPKDRKPLPQGGIGDIVIAPKFRLMSQESDIPLGDLPLGLALIPAVTFPTGDSDNFQGEQTVAFLPRLALSRYFDFGLNLALNIHYLLRKNADLGATKAGDELGYGFGVGYDIPINPMRLYISWELLGSFMAASPFKNKNESPLEWLLGIKFNAANGLGFGVAGGSGILPGIGTPTYRLMASMIFASGSKNREIAPMPPEPESPPELKKPEAASTGQQTPKAEEKAKEPKENKKKIGDGLLMN